MKSLIPGALACVLAASLMVSPAAAHDDFEAYEARCLEVPRMLRRQATNHQWFEITNVSRERLMWYFFGTNPLGTLSGNLVRRQGDDWGVLEGYTSVYTSNTRIQRRKVDMDEEEPALLCFEEYEDAGAGFGDFDGHVLVREMRRFNGQWIALDLTDWWSWWTVTEHEGTATYSKSAPDGGTLMLRGQRLEN